MADFTFLFSAKVFSRYSAKRNKRDAPIATIDMELNVVRSELQALYETGRKPPQHHPSASRATMPQLV